jgi:hypothetical protein
MTVQQLQEALSVAAPGSDMERQILSQALAAARDEALEEAARHLDRGPLSARIRALKSPAQKEGGGR